MKTSFLTQSPTASYEDSIRSLLIDRIGTKKFDFARVAVAYATVSGVRALLAAFETHGLKKSLWLLGLDDAITQPGAIELLLSLDGADVRIASCEGANLRFHPKFFAFAHVDRSKQLLSLIGSANLTASALCGNAEAVAILEAKNEGDRTSVNAAWSRLWVLGHKPTATELEAYKDLYEKASRFDKKRRALIAKKKTTRKSSEVLASDEAELDPSMAKICWIECGKVTAMGRELEFKAEQGIFFGLNPSGGKSKKVPIGTSDGRVINLTMKYQENHMWRLQMNNQVPEVKRGLRPKQKGGTLGRSPYVAVFQRNDGTSIGLRFISLTSGEFAKLRRQTSKHGTLGRTAGRGAREYGWV